MAKLGLSKGVRGAEFAEAVREEIVKLELGDKDLTAQRGRELRETTFGNAKQIERLVMSQLALAEKDPAQILRVASGMKALSLAAGALAKLHALQHTVLGLDRHVDEQELPRIIIDQFTDDEIAAIRCEDAGEDVMGAEPIEEAAVDLTEPIPGSLSATLVDDDDIVVLGHEDDEDEEPVPTLLPAPRADEDGHRLVRDGR